MYQKIRFALNAISTNPEEVTAGLVLKADKLRQMSVSDISRLFPHSETSKMRGVLQISRKYETFEEAFEHQFGLTD